ncbi:MAG: starch-binding protein, partial [Oscillospiraceae bacterium]|nr:starch-binding protein [Oscillospiraceae bacterium]
MKKLCALLCVLAMVCALCVPVMAAPEGTITVHVDPFDDWTNISLYVWIDASNNLAAWPGTAMTDADGDGWYELEIPAGYPNVIVAADGGNQTVDMTMDG